MSSRRTSWKSGINAAALATFFKVNIDTSKLGDLAVVDSADEFAAAAVLAADTLVHQYLTEGNIRQYVQSEELPPSWWRCSKTAWTLPTM